MREEEEEKICLIYNPPSPTPPLASLYALFMNDSFVFAYVGENVETF